MGERVLVSFCFFLFRRHFDRLRQPLEITLFCLSAWQPSLGDHCAGDVSPLFEPVFMCCLYQTRARYVKLTRLFLFFLH